MTVEQTLAVMIAVFVGAYIAGDRWTAGSVARETILSAASVALAITVAMVVA